MAIPLVTIQGKVVTPSGVPFARGTVIARLNTHGCVVDGADVAADSVVAQLGPDGSVSLQLVPNDAIVPSGTAYLMTFEGYLRNGRKTTWQETWQLASDPSPIDVGSVPRPGVAPGVAVVSAPAVAQAAADAQASATASAAAASSSATAAASSASAAAADRAAVESGSAQITATGTASTKPLRDWMADVKRASPVAEIRRSAGRLAHDFTAGVYTVRGTATSPAVSYDAVRGATRLAWSSAQPAQFVGAVADGTWDFSGDAAFALDFGFERAEWLAKIEVVFSFDATHTDFINYAVATVQADQLHLPRVTHTFTKAGLTVVGTPNWAAVKHIEVRLVRTGFYRTTGDLYLYGLWAGVQARAKVLVTFDDFASTFVAEGLPRMKAAGLRGSIFAVGSLVGTAGFGSLPQLQQAYADGWDVGNHTWTHRVLAAQTGASLYSRVGTAATLAIPSTLAHGKAPGQTISVGGCDESLFNGTFTVDTVPNPYTVTFTLPGTTSDQLQARGYAHVIGFVSSAVVRSEYRTNRDWLLANGFARAADHFAWPTGAWDAEAAQVLREEGAKTARGTGPLNGGSHVLPTWTGIGAPYNLPAVDLNSSTTAAAALALVDQAIAEQGTIIFYGHGLAASNPAATQMLISEFQALVDGLKARSDAAQIDVVTISEWYDRLGAARGDLMPAALAATTLSVGKDAAIGGSIAGASASVSGAVSAGSVASAGAVTSGAGSGANAFQVLQAGGRLKMSPGAGNDYLTGDGSTITTPGNLWVAGTATLAGTTRIGGSSGPVIIQGSGAPSGDAPLGSIYIRTDTGDWFQKRVAGAGAANWTLK